MTKPISSAALLFFFLCAAGALAQVRDGHELVHPTLVAAADGIQPGGSVVVGLHLEQQPGWHTYWQYSGDAGLATAITWNLPSGWSAGQIGWPVPARLIDPGDIITYGYREEVVLPVTITAPAGAKVGDVARIAAHASWLVCKEICVPGKADVALDLPVVAASHPANAEIFARSKAEETTPQPFAARWSREGQTLVLQLGGLPQTGAIDFFPLPGAVQVGHAGVSGSTVRIPLLDPAENATSIDGLVVLGTGGATRAWRLSGAAAAASGSVAMGHGQSLLYWLALGFLGGLILNVMPCVLPVIALKIFGFIRQAGESPRRILALGFTFVGGIFAWFLFLAALIVGFKAAGHQLNWAFQFQHPGFVGGMVVILLVFSLNLLGVFELVLPSSVQNRMQHASDEEGYAGTFWHGVFATLMATPCTAPFLGPALGFALVQPAPIVFAMFGSIAAGMSAPYAILAVRPAWIRYLPRPGMWMIRVKQGLGVLLLGTVLWLGSVFYAQVTRRVEPFAPRLERALAQHRIVFVDFTADWCINCKVNERLVLDNAGVRDAFARHHVILLKADWTNGPADITALLRKFGRAGVPCYVVYPPDGQPIVLPEVITREIVLSALDRAAG